MWETDGHDDVVGLAKKTNRGEGCACERGAAGVAGFLAPSSSARASAIARAKERVLPRIREGAAPAATGAARGGGGRGGSAAFLAPNIFGEPCG